MTVGAHLISSDARSESRRFSIAQAITPQFIAASSACATATTLIASRFQVINRAIDSGLQVRILAFRHTRNRNDALRQSFEINLDRNWLAWSTRNWRWLI